MGLDDRSFSQAIKVIRSGYFSDVNIYKVRSSLRKR